MNSEPGAGSLSRSVLVTGGASGIGEAVVERLIADGYGVVAFDLQESVIRDWGTLGLGVIGDATRDDDLARALQVGIERYGPLAGVVAGAGIASPGTVLETEPSQWQKVIEINLTSVYKLARLSLPHLLASGGSFVAIASQVGLVGYPRNAAYCTTKAGVINLMRCIALDYAAQGVRANAVCPGPIDTPMTQVAFASSGEDYSIVTQRIPAGRMGLAREVAGACSYLISDDSVFVNGTTLVVDGGYTAQ